MENPKVSILGLERSSTVCFQILAPIQRKQWTLIYMVMCVRADKAVAELIYLIHKINELKFIPPAILISALMA
jgi:hypothetical protein